MWKYTRGLRSLFAETNAAGFGPEAGAPPFAISDARGGFVAFRNDRSGVRTSFTTRRTTFATLFSISRRSSSCANARRGNDCASSLVATPRKITGPKRPKRSSGLVTSRHPSTYTPGAFALNVHCTFFTSPGRNEPSISVRNQALAPPGPLECGNSL